MKWDVGYVPVKRDFQYEPDDRQQWRPIVKLPPHTDTITRARFSPDGKFIASVGSDGVLQVIDLLSEKCIGASIVHFKGINDLSWDGGGRHIYTASSDGMAHCIALNQLSMDITQASDASNSSRKSYSFVSFESESKRPSTIYKKKLKMVESQPYHPAIVGSVKHHSAQSVMATESGVISDSKSMIDPPQISDQYDLLYEAVTCVSSPHFIGQYFLTGGYNELVRKWDTRRFDHVVSDVRAHDGPLSSIEHSKDDRIFVTSSLDGHARLWTTEELEPLRSFSGNQDVPLSHACISPCERLLLCIPIESNCRLWSIPQPAEFLNLMPPVAASSPVPEVVKLNKNSSELSFVVAEVTKLSPALIPSGALEPSAAIKGSTDLNSLYSAEAQSKTPDELSLDIQNRISTPRRSPHQPLISDTPVEYLSAPGPFVFGAFHRGLIFVPVASQFLGQRQSIGINIWRSNNGKFVGRLSAKPHRYCEITSVDTHPMNLPIIASSGDHPDNSVVLWMCEESEQTMNYDCGCDLNASERTQK